MRRGILYRLQTGCLYGLFGLCIVAIGVLLIPLGVLGMLVWAAWRLGDALLGFLVARPAPPQREERGQRQ